MILKLTAILLLLTFVAGGYIVGRTKALSDNALQAEANTLPTESHRTALTTDANMAKLELRTIQKLVIEMMVDNDLLFIPHPLTKPTNDLSKFPDPISMATGKGLTPWDRDGYVLYGHDKTADRGTDIVEDYTNVQFTLWAYTIDEDGTVHQHDGILSADKMTTPKKILDLMKNHV